MSKNPSLYPTTFDTEFTTDRASGDTITSSAYDILESAVTALETKVGVDSSAITTSIDYKVNTFLTTPTISSNNISAVNISATNVYATTITGTTFSGTNVYATTVTATNLTAVDISATSYSHLPYITWTDVTGTSVTMSANNAYIINNAGIVSATLPGSAGKGAILEIVGYGAGMWKIVQAAGQTIHFGNLDTTTGATGYLSATSPHDSVRLACVVASTDYVIVGVVGNIVVV